MIQTLQIAKDFPRNFVENMSPERVLPQSKIFEKLPRKDDADLPNQKKKKIQGNLLQIFLLNLKTLPLLLLHSKISCVHQINGDRRSLIYCEATNKNQKHFHNKSFEHIFQYLTQDLSYCEEIPPLNFVKLIFFE